MFDANLILMDGSVVTTTSLDTPATSCTRNTTATDGAAVIDLQETGARGMSAVMILSELVSPTADAYYVEAFLEASDVLAFTSDLHKLTSFDLLGGTTGRILGIETPCTIVAKFATDKRYLRVNLTVSNNFGYIKVYLTNSAFKVL